MISSLKIYLSKYPKLFLKLRVINKVGLSTTFINWVFQRILRKNANLKISVNFTSVVFPEKIDYNYDLTTLASFSASGGCYFQAINGIIIGENFLFAPGVKLISANHSLENPERKSLKGKPIIIGSNVWLGANVIILPEVTIGNNTIIGAGAVVTKSFEKGHVILAGNPAKIIRKLNYCIPDFL